jgi:hypothetical protein
MNRSILNAFLADQRTAKSIVASKLNVPEDVAAVEWALRHAEIRDAYQANPFADIFSPHGFGLELKIGDLYIDYDYSETGRPDGFDDWRLFVYLTAGQFDNNEASGDVSVRVREWVNEMARLGYFVHLDNLYYINPDQALPA